MSVTTAVVWIVCVISLGQVHRVPGVPNFKEAEKCDAAARAIDPDGRYGVVCMPQQVILFEYEAKENQ